MSAPTITAEAPPEARADDLQEALDQAKAVDAGESSMTGAELEKASPAGYLTLDPSSARLTNAQKTALLGLGLNVDDKEAWPHIAMFIHTCQVAGLDPYRRQAHLIPRGNKWTDDDGNVKGKITYTYQTGIDGFRTMAGRTGRFIKRVGPFWAAPDIDPNSWIYDPDAKVMRKRWYEVWPDAWGYPAFARVDIHFINTEGVPDVHEQTAAWHHFVPMMPVYRYDENQKKRVKQFKDGQPVEDVAVMWKKMGAHMLGKVCEAQAFRSVFPDQCSAFYEAAEFHRADAEEIVSAQVDATMRRREAFEQARAARTVPAQRNDTRPEHKVIDHEDDAAPGRLQLSEDEIAAGMMPLPDPITAPPAGDTEVHDADVIAEDDGGAYDDEPDPALYLAELEAWAALYGKTAADQLARVLAAKRITDPAELPVEALADQIKKRRPYTVTKLRELGRPDDAAAVEEGELLHTRGAQ